MRLPLETQIELMAWTDHEVPDDVRDRVARLLEESDDARQFVEGLRSSHMSEWVQEAVHGRLSEVPSITDAVMDRIEGRPASLSTVPSLRRREDRRRIRAIGIAVSASLAVAACLALYFRSNLSPNAVSASVALHLSSSAPSAEPSSDPRAMAIGGGTRGVEVNDIDAVSHAISVFEIPLGAAAANAAKSVGGSSVVIWIDEDRKPK